MVNNPATVNSRVMVSLDMANSRVQRGRWIFILIWALTDSGFRHLNMEPSGFRM